MCQLILLTFSTGYNKFKHFFGQIFFKAQKVQKYENLIEPPFAWMVFEEPLSKIGLNKLFYYKLMHCLLHAYFLFGNGQGL